MSPSVDGCPFCDPVVQARAVEHYGDVFILPPRSPIAPGHMLAVPRWHVSDALQAPAITADTMQAACAYARDNGVKACNLITSAGRPATQTVFHLHIHLVPRVRGDRLRLPWTSGGGKESL